MTKETTTDELKTVFDRNTKTVLIDKVRIWRKAMTEWTPPASDHELNKRLADAIGLEVYLAGPYTNPPGVWMSRLLPPGSTWLPTTDWNQAMRCAEFAEENGWEWLTRVDVSICGKGVRDIGPRFEKHSTDKPSQLRSFCHVILRALEHGKEQAAA